MNAAISTVIYLAFPLCEHNLTHAACTPNETWIVMFLLSFISFR